MSANYHPVWRIRESGEHGLNYVLGKIPLSSNPPQAANNTSLLPVPNNTSLLPQTNNTSLLPVPNNTSLLPQANNTSLLPVPNLDIDPRTIRRLRIGI